MAGGKGLGFVLKGALTRAYRVFVYTFVGSGAVAAIPDVKALADIRPAASALAIALTIAVASAVVAFLVATAELGADHALIGPRAPSTNDNGETKDGSE